MKKILLSAVITGGVMTLQAENAFFQASLTPDIAIYSRTTYIQGLSLDIWGENPQSSLNIGLVNGSTGNSSGLSWGLANYDDSYHGVQWGWINYSREEFIGWQDAFINVSQGTFAGVQSGFVNYSEKFQGLQVGFLNYAEDLRGVQLGFVNVAMNNPWFNEFPNKLAPAFPIVNWSF